MKKTFILLLIVASIMVYGAVPAGKVPMNQVTGLNTALNAKLSLTTADTRYNKVSDNINPWQYLYRKTQTDSLFLKLDPNHADPNQSIYGNITMTDGSLNLDNGEIYASTNIATGGRIRAFNEFRTGSNIARFTVNDGSTNAFSVVQSTIATDSKPSIFSLFGNATENTLVVSSDDGRNPFSRYVLSAGQTQITPAYPDGNVLVPLGIFDITNSLNTKHLFTIWDNGQVKAYNFISDMQTVVSASGTTTLTNGSAKNTYITGSTTQTVVLPDATKLLTGQSFKIYNSSTGLVTVQNGSSSTLLILASGTLAEFTCANISTVAGVWVIDQNANSIASGKKLTVNNSVTFTGTDGTSFALPTSSKTLAASDGSNITALASSTTATTQAQTVNNTTLVTTAWARLYTQPMYATPTVLTAGATVTWTPALGVDQYTLTPTSATTINMGTIPASMVGATVVLRITTSGTTSYALTFGTNLRHQGVLNTGTVTAAIFQITYKIVSTTSVVEMCRTAAM